MAWPKGKPLGKKVQGSGRKSGTPNKRTQEVLEIFKRYHYNPIISMIKIAQDQDVGIEIRKDMHKELAQYGFPKRKAIEHSGEVDVNQSFGVLFLGEALTEEDLQYASGRTNGTTSQD